MSWAGSERVSIYVGLNSAGGMAFRGDDGAATPWWTAESATAAFERAARDLAERPRRRFGKCLLDIQLSGALARPFLFEPVAGLQRWREAMEIAATLAPEATGLQGPCAVWLADWRAERRCVGVAVDLELRDQLERIAQAARLRLAVMRPWWTTAIDRALAPPAASAKLLVARDTDALTVLIPDADAGYAALATYAPIPAPQQARALVARAAMASNIAAEAIVLAGLSERTDEEGARQPISLNPVLEPWT